MSNLISIPIADLAVGDVIDSRRRPIGPVRPATVTRLQRLRHGLTRVWVKPHASRWSVTSESNFGTYAPADIVKKVGE
ncbi:hypothetical protein ACIRCZ_03170 [Leifsonia sp. NPDC102414]|uniref:hypothetical protein n=1 Tax=Leifsonia sp. NPDC102414 TaxID=3364124 RepID=UPI003815F99C